MPIVGHGIDLTPVARIAALRERHAERFLERVFTRAERDYCALRPRRTDEHLAARFAAKEATLKALGTGLTAGIRWIDISVEREDTAPPTLRLTGAAAQAAERLAANRWHVSLSHAGGMAIASVIAETELNSTLAPQA